jgi:hypothetical protein
LSFASRTERLTIPLAAVTTFADPSVKFGLQFQAPAEGAPAEGATDPPAAALPTARSTSPPAVEKPEPAGAEIVTLDRFRKR